MAETAKKVAKKKVADAPKYGVEYLAKKTGLAEATIRIKLRELKVKKEGKSYGWATVAEADAIAKKLKAAAEE